MAAPQTTPRRKKPSLGKSSAKKSSAGRTKKSDKKAEPPKCRTIDSYFAKRAKNPVARLQPKNLSKIFNDVSRIEEGPLKGLPVTLLDQIKPKKVDDEEAQRKKMIARLPDLVKIVHLFFLTDPKPVPKELLIQKCIDSFYTFISVPETEKQLRLISEILPEWLTFISIRKNEYVKVLDRKKTLNEIIEKINSM